MNYQTIGEIYEANAKIREKLKAVIANLSDDELDSRLDENGWTIREIVEHLSIVENGMTKICTRLLRQSAEENLPNDGKTAISAEFLEKSKHIANRREKKLPAPERVLPGENLSIAESLAKMDENAELLQQIRLGLENTDTNKHKFPHPFFGDLNASEWLALIGGHELRHIDQIKEILSAQK